MSAGLEGHPVEWYWPPTLADLIAYDTLPANLRASIERCLRARSSAVPSGEPKDEEYIRGWKDGVEAMQDELQSIYIHPPSKRPPKEPQRTGA